MEFDFAVVAVGSTGDIMPLAAIAQGLKNNGYQVRLITHENFRQLAAKLGLPFAPIAGDYREFLQSPDGIKVIKGEVPPWNEPQQIKEERLLQLHQSLDSARGAKAIIVGPLSLWASNVTEKLGIPIIIASYFPLMKTGYFPILKFGKGIDKTINAVQKWANATSYDLVKILKAFSDRKTINQFRQSVGMEKRPILPRYNPETAKQVLILHQYSKSVLPSPPDWKDAGYATETVGYCFIDEGSEYEPPQALIDFINSSDRPIISIGFGSMPIGDPEQIYELISQAIGIAEVRCIFILGWGSNNDIGELFKPNQDIYLTKEVPYSWLFPKMRAVVHHCGAGTTALSVRAGVPAVPVPFFADNPAWAERLHGLGVASEPIPAKALTAARLAQAIAQAIESKDMANRAQTLAAKVNQENGVQQAVEAIDRFMF